MSQCQYCMTEKQDVQIDGGTVEVCMHTGCIMDRMLEQYQGCNHDLQQEDDHLLKCSKCGMGATPSYTMGQV